MPQVHRSTLARGAFLLPTGIAVAEDGSVYVTDAHSDRVLVFDPLDLPTSDAEAGLPAELKLKYPTSGVEIDAGELPLLGTGKPGTTIHVLVDGEMLGEAVVDQDGVWALTLEFVEPGAYDLYLEAFAMQESAEGVSAPELIATTGPIPLVVRDR